MGALLPRVVGRELRNLRWHTARAPVADRYRQPATVEQPSDERFDVVAVGIGDKLGECGRTTVEGLEDAPLLTGESGEFLVARRVQEYPARRRDEARCAVAQAEPGPGG